MTITAIASVIFGNNNEANVAIVDHEVKLSELTTNYQAMISCDDKVWRPFHGAANGKIVRCDESYTSKWKIELWKLIMNSKFEPNVKKEMINEIAFFDHLFQLHLSLKFGNWDKEPFVTLKNIITTNSWNDKTKTFDKVVEDNLGEIETFNVQMDEKTERIYLGYVNEWLHLHHAFEVPRFASIA